MVQTQSRDPSPHKHVLQWLNAGKNCLLLPWWFYCLQYWLLQFLTEHNSFTYLTFWALCGIIGWVFIMNSLELNRTKKRHGTQMPCDPTSDLSTCISQHSRNTRWLCSFFLAFAHTAPLTFHLLPTPLLLASSCLFFQSEPTCHLPQ